jgi:CBS domain-containing protein
MHCEEVMKTLVVCCWAGESVQDAAARMRARGVGFLPVVNDDGQVIGTVTDRDLVVQALADGLAPGWTPVESVMSLGVIYCYPDDPISVAEKQMMRNRVSRIICIDWDGRPVGIISLSDIARREWSWRSGKVLRTIASREARAGRAH